MIVQVYTSTWCRDCRAAKQFLDSHNIQYSEVNVDADPAASAEVIRHVGKRAVPQLVIDGEWFQPYKPDAASSTTSCIDASAFPSPEQLNLVQSRVGEA